MTDLTAPTDPVMADCVAALAIVRADFDAAHVAVGVAADTFAADIEVLVAGSAGWGAAVRLAEQERGS